MEEAREDLSCNGYKTQERNFEQKRQVSLLFRSPSADFRRSKNAPSSVTALILGVSERTIQRWKPESLKQKRLSQEEVLKIQELKEEGKSRREIANEIGVSHTAINKLETSDKCQKFPDPSPSYLAPDDDKALPICPTWTDGTTISILPTWQDLSIKDLQIQERNKEASRRREIRSPLHLLNKILSERIMFVG
jgi:DNA-binding XRE family transcriptional regulator